MKSKIGKLGKLGELKHLDRDTWIVMAINAIIEKQGEIIDHLNSQDQEEEKPVSFTDALVEMDRIENMTEEEYNEEVEDTTEERGENDWKGRFFKKFGHLEIVRKEAMNKVYQKYGFTGFISQELDKAREEVIEKLRLGFYETFYQSGELWFDYGFSEDDTEEVEEAKAFIEEYWEDVKSKLNNNK